MTNISYYIVANDDNSIRFFVIGYFIDGKFSGVMHDYTGAGNYEEKLVYNDQFIPDSTLNGEQTEWDHQIDLFESLTGLCYTTDLEPYIEDKFITYDTKQFNYVIADNQHNKFTDNVLIHNCNLCIPYGLGNTSFVDGYEINTIGK